jgi:hypothetical protein
MRGRRGGEEDEAGEEAFHGEPFVWKSDLLGWRFD